MARDVCSDCEQQFPGGEGLKDGLCSGCRKARRELAKAAKEQPPEEEARREEE